MFRTWCAWMHRPQAQVQKRYWEDDDQRVSDAHRSGYLMGVQSNENSRKVAQEEAKECRRVLLAAVMQAGPGGLRVSLKSRAAITFGDRLVSQIDTQTGDLILHAKLVNCRRQDDGAERSPRAVEGADGLLD